MRTCVRIVPKSHALHAGVRLQLTKERLVEQALKTAASELVGRIPDEIYFRDDLMLVIPERLHRATTPKVLRIVSVSRRNVTVEEV